MSESLELQQGSEQAGELLLALDTSSASMTAALLKGRELVAERLLHAERNHSIRLLPLIEEMLHTAGAKPADLGALATGVGPGSYTGVRIGVTVAKTMAWAQQLPVAGISSLATLALGALLPEGEEAPLVSAVDARKGLIWVVPLFGARRGQAYTALFQIGEEGIPMEGIYPGANAPVAYASAWESGLGWQMSRTQADSIRLAADWLEQLASWEEEKEPPERPSQVVFVGETAEFLPLLEEYAERRGGSTLIREGHLRGYATGLLAVPMLEAKATEDPHLLLPNYTQLSEAEAKLLARRREGASS
ncbi:tRNA (adenosine(37)-N6)-threonylcarbamoyltransferase complex dimerization subunit type 1 TsaB [Gorillibacterium sp. CAU 1737]|uniref:tRNA (adenosine(37)-N6)-threonylcarbamoyltransferase complex dimerization subunit type 1 TsaB n=1 Tax=Gorillibacterium sp. CAU 1737 TaxID=3140362 RepID=UPI0032604C22